MLLALTTVLASVEVAVTWLVKVVAALLDGVLTLKSISTVAPAAMVPMLQVFVLELKTTALSGL